MITLETQAAGLAGGTQGNVRPLARPLIPPQRGDRIPRNWGAAQLQALQEGYEEGQAQLVSFFSSISATASTNYWTILNTIIGTYPNTQEGYRIRSTIVMNGGSANVPADAVYPNLTTYL